jgi:hypothetical protein
MQGKPSTAARRARFGRPVTAALATGAALVTGMLVTGAQANAADLPYGPYTCANGYVWREATPSDVVCVAPQIRTQTTTENQLGPSRREPDGGPYGADTCKTGYVWRETSPADHVCVPPASRDQARSDNANAPRRLVDPGATPHGGVTVSTLDNQSGGRLTASGGGMTPNSTLSFYAVGINTTGPFSLGFPVTTDSAGNIPGNSYVGDVTCRSGLTQSATIVVVDQKSGLVTTAGTSDAFRHCG